jgi:hypothetical protein
MLSFAVTLTLALLLWRCVTRYHGPVVGILTAACFLALPLVQESSWMMMADLLQALFVLLAVLAFARFLETFSNGTIAWFVLWSVMAILTKGSGWAIGIFAVLAPVVSLRTECFRKPAYWISGVAIVALGAPFYVLTRMHGIGYADDPVRYATGSIAAASAASRFEVVFPMLTFVPGFVLISVLLAAVAVIWRLWGNGDRSAGNIRGSVALAWILSQLVFIFVLPLTGQIRYLTPAIGPVMILLGGAIAGVGFVSRRWRAAGEVAPFALAALCFAASFGALPERVDGYSAAAASLPAAPSGDVMLVSSDSKGSGAFIAARLEHDIGRRDVLFRSDKVLSHSNWAGRQFTALYPLPKQVDQFLRSSPIRYVVFDEAVAPDPAQAVLLQCLRSSPETFIPIGRFPVQSRNQRRAGDIVIYQNREAREQDVIDVNLGPSHAGKVLRYRRK